MDALQLVGRTIADKYAVESVVGEGGFATVYRATHLIWKRPVALKVFKALGDFPAEHRQKLLDEFVQEGALLGDLSARSAAIVQARDIGMLQTADGSNIPYMVLEWLDGATLEEVLAAEKARGLPLRTLSQAVELLDPAAQALALAHKHGIAHRDVKPANIFVVGDPRGDYAVKLLDFGIAKVVNDAQKMAGMFNKTSGKMTSFTPAYGAPEQFSRSHGATGPWSDVFALGLIVAELVSGREPLEGDDFVQLAVASGNAYQRSTPRGLGAQVSDEVEAVCGRALAPRPTDRWQSAGEFWNALRQAISLAPMRGMTDPMPASLGGRSSRPDSVPLTAINTVPRAATARGDGSGAARPALLAVLGVAVLGGLGAAAFFLGRGPKAAGSTAASSSATGATSGAASAAVVPAAPPGCPTGMISIPGGSFFMGSDDGLPLEKPAHPVTLAPFCIDEFEVTVERYLSCSEGGKCKRAGTSNAWDKITDKEKAAFDPLCTIREPDAKAKHPINCVDWEMADRFCRVQGGRLPTEAEWEFAARGPDGRRYPWGDDDPGAAHLNACGKECVAWGAKHGIDEKAMYDVDDGFPNTAPVGSFPKGASRYGVQDVVGNVWEWVSDYYGTYGVAEQKNPTGPEAGEERVIRGGAWNGSYPSWVRPTFRYKDRPDKRSYGIGFRCAK